MPGFPILCLGGALLFYAPASLCSASALLITDLLRHCIVPPWTALRCIAAAQLCLDPPCHRSSRIFFAFAMLFDTSPRLAEPLRSCAKPCSPNKACLASNCLPVLRKALALLHRWCLSSPCFATAKDCFYLLFYRGSFRSYPLPQQRHFVLFLCVAVKAFLRLCSSTHCHGSAVPYYAIAPLRHAVPQPCSPLLFFNKALLCHTIAFQSSALPGLSDVHRHPCRAWPS